MTSYDHGDLLDRERAVDSVVFALTVVEGDVGGRAILRSSDDAALVETGERGVRQDVDRPSDVTGRRDRATGGRRLPVTEPPVWSVSSTGSGTVTRSR